MSAAYIGAVSHVDKHGRRMRAFHVVTLETDAYGTEHLGWALVPAGRPRRRGKAHPDALA